MILSRRELTVWWLSPSDCDGKNIYKQWFPYLNVVGVDSVLQTGLHDKTGPTQIPQCVS
jgi:hypothetical protein